MKEFATNRFYKGINTDVSLLERDNQVLLDALNTRITSKSTDGLFEANVKGNREEFQLNDGFLPIGAVEYGGILFILSANATTGEGEIGTFPTPNGTTEGFTRVYSALNNFTLDNPNIFPDECAATPPDIERRGFTTTELNFSCEHQARLLARIDFDKSVNLYWTDNFNPIRSINTGFHSETGLYNERYVSEIMVRNGIIDIISENNFTPKVKLDSLGKDGVHRAGHYFFFVRYIDIAFNTSSFLGMSSAVPIFIEYVQPAAGNLAFGLESREETNRNVILNITNLDTEEAFVEIGYVYYWGKDEFEAKLIDIRHPIAGSNSLQINILGNEPTIDLSLDEIVGYKPVDAIFAKDIAQIDNKLYIANTRGVPIDHPDLRKFFCLIEIGEDSSYSKNAEPYRQSGGAANDDLYGEDPLEVHEKVAYWSGETYVFSAVPVFRGGFVGPAFPLKGFDNFTGTPQNPNQSGIYRFSKASEVPYYQANEIFVKGVKFDTNDALAFFNSSDFLKENVIGVYFCRGERVRNIQYQGMMVPCYSGNDYNGPALTHFNSLRTLTPSSDEFFADVYTRIPMLENAAPYWLVIQEAGLSSTPSSFFGFSWYNHSSIVGNYGVFSFDYHIDQGLSQEGVGPNSYLERVGKIENWSPRAPGTSGQQGVVTQQYPQLGIYKIFEQNDITYTTTGNAGAQVDSYNIGPGDPAGVVEGNTRYVSYIGEGTSNGGLFFAKIDRDNTDDDEWMISLPWKTPAYIMFDNQSFDPLMPSSERFNHIMNVCKTNPAGLDYSTVYDFKNTLFSPISEIISIDELIANPKPILYGGDCFVARTYLKVMNFDDNVGDGTLGVIAIATDGATKFTSLSNTPGVILSIVTENNYNPNYRFQKGRNSFFPKDWSWATKRNSPESDFYNTGYQRMLNPRQFLGIDRLKPFSDDSFPTRIRPSIKHVLNSLKDGYLQFTPGDFKDFDFQYGPINALMAVADQLYSFQDDAINLHPINERAVAQSDGTDTPFILGESRELTEFKRAISTEFGTQHQWSIIKGEAGIYGFDWNKGVFWRVGGNGFENLGIIKNCEKWIEDITVLQNSGVSDITEQLLDNPVCRQGIHAVYDREYKEVLMTFIFGPNEEDNYTISYSEKGEHFNTKWSFKPRFYAELERDLYSFQDGSFWLHDANPLYSNFYGTQYPSRIRFVVNPKGELAKHWDNIIISSNNREFSRILYETQHQLAEQNPFSGEFWNRPIYREFQWKLPIRRADIIKDPQLSLGLVDSRMRGRYLIVELEYFGDQYLWIREVITGYTQSKA